MPTTDTLASVLDGLASTLSETAKAVRQLHDREADLPPTLKVRHIAKLEGWANSTVWRKAKLGELGPMLSAPGEPIRFDRDTYLAHRRRRRERAEGA